MKHDGYSDDVEHLPAPDLEDLQGREVDEEINIDPVPVEIVGSVQTYRMAARTTSMRNLMVDGTETICNEDPRRARVLLYATSGTAAWFIGNDKQMVDSGASPRFNSGQQVELFISDRLYARSASPGTACQLTVIQENWAD